VLVFEVVCSQACHSRSWLQAITTVVWGKSEIHDKTPAKEPLGPSHAGHGVLSFYN